MGWAPERLRAALLAAALAGAAGDAAPQVAVMEPYQEAAGLASMAVAGLAQAADGRLWIATENGLFRFDGFHVVREALPEGAGPDITDVEADRLGRLWVATDTGLYLRRCDGGGVRWSAVVSPNGVGLGVEGKQRLAVDERGSVFAVDRRGRVWTIPVPQTPAPRIVAALLRLPAYTPFVGAFDADGGPIRAIGTALWFGCGRGLCRWLDGRLRAWGPDDGLPADTWGSLVAAHDGSVWARGTGHLARLAPAGERFDTVDAPAAKLWPATTPLAEDRAGRILTGADDGLARWDGHAWRYWTPREGIPETAVRALLLDADGELWMGSAGRGLHRWVGYGRVEHWTTATGLPSPVVWSFARDGAGQMVVATSRGVARLDPSTQRFADVDPVYAPVPGNALASDGAGAVWWVDDGHVMTLSPGMHHAREAFFDPTVAVVVPAPHSIILSGPHVAQRLVVGPDGPRREPLPPGMPDPGTLTAVVGDGQREWFLVGDGAYRIDGGRWEPLRDDAGTPVQVRLIGTFAGPSEFWAADARGIAVYHVADGVARLAQRIDTSRLGTTDIAFMRPDRQGRMWIGTDRGAFVRSGARWTLLDRGNGMLWDDLDSQAFHVDPDGAVWIGTSMGATRVLPGGLDAAPPVLRVEEIRFGDRPVAAGPAMHVAWIDRRLRLTLRTPDIARGASTRLEYRLGEDAAWEGLPGNVLQLESLEARAYRVQVRAAARTPLAPPGAPVEIAFTVEPPLWRSTPAYAAYALILVAAWFLSIEALSVRARALQRRLERAIAERTAELERSRELVRGLGTHNARALEEERKRIARELHDEMGQQLAALRMEISVLKRQAAGGRGPDGGALDALVARVDRVVAGMRGVVAQLRPPALDGGLRAGLEWLAAELERHSGVPCAVDVDDSARRLSPEAAAMVFRIAQESLNNVRRHAAANRAWLGLHAQGANVVLSIRDDGIGFDAADPRAGYGLLGMEERARALGGLLSVASAAGQGTTVSLHLPLPPAAAAPAG